MHKAPVIWGFISFFFGSGLQVSGWTNVYVASIFWLVAAGLFIYAIRDYASQTFPGRWVSLSAMAVRVYDMTRGTHWGKQIDSMARNDEDTKLGICAHHVALTDVPLFGTRPPATRYEEIDKDMLGQFDFADRGSVLKHHGQGQPPFWTNLSIRWWDQWKVMRQLRKETMQVFERKRRS